MLNQATIDLVKEFEGLRTKAYKDSVGIWTIGYGTTARAGVGIDPAPGMVITEAEAEYYLQKGLEKFSTEITGAITRPINENEFGAFVSLAYNIGSGAFKRSTALRKFNAGDKQGAANAILMWNKAGGKVLKGLVRRREAERALFLTPVRVETPETETKADRSNVAKTSTAQATAIQVASAAGAGITAVSSLDGTAQLVLIGCLALVVVAAMWIFKERLRKFRMGDR